MPDLKSNDRNDPLTAGQGKVTIGALVAEGVGAGAGSAATGAGAVTTVPPVDDPAPPQLDSSRIMRIREYLAFMMIHPGRGASRGMKSV